LTLFSTMTLTATLTSTAAYSIVLALHFDPLRRNRWAAKGHADIADQLRRAAQSQPLNIAEGADRTSRPDVAKHYTIPQRYDRGVDLLTSVVAMPTKMI
jgi:hypothetical protein